ncbi:hypothetical protein [Haloarcula montana]|uniref:hypothetical protein n=1 Tax=Haloarcula montana TaxID=3111776 RepID=UPI002D77A5F2|nr:hypothetical protein [Haloarcula sp. GH36]
MNTLGDIIVDSLKEGVRVLVTPIETVLAEFVDPLIELIVSTPTPDTVFGRPTNDAWPAVYDFYWDTMIPLTLFLWALSIGLVIFLESTSHLFGSYHQAKLKRRTFAGLLGILMWWWVAALSLQFVNALTGFLVPDLSEITLFETLSFSAMGVIGIAIALLTDLLLFVLIALLYFIRQVVLYLFVVMMPLLIVFWIPGVGPFVQVSRLMSRLAGFYTPFLFMTVPVALLFRLGELIGGSVNLSMKGFGQWLMALVIPIVAIAAPFVLFWQAGAIFLMADRASHRLSSQRASDRLARGSDVGQTGVQGGQNFVRGARGQPAVRADGQTVLDSGNSRAHAVGSRLHTATTSVSESFERRGGGRGGSGGSSLTDSTDRSRTRRDADFSNLRSRPDRTSGESGTRTDSDRTAIDDSPRYIQ